MNKSTTVVLGAILAVAALGIATVAIAPMEAHANNQQNWQGEFNFNNQQFKSNFQCSSYVYACSP